MKKHNSPPLPKVLSVLLPMFSVITVGFLLALGITYDYEKANAWRGIRPEVKDTMLALVDYGDLNYQSLAYYASLSPQWSRIQWFVNYGTRSEMLKLSNHPNPGIKKVAYEAMLKRGYINYDLILKSFQEPNLELSYMEGFIPKQIFLGDYLMNQVLKISERPYWTPTRFQHPIKHVLSAEEINKIRALYKKRQAALARF